MSIILFSIATIIFVLSMVAPDDARMPVWWVGFIVMMVGLIVWADEFSKAAGS